MKLVLPILALSVALVGCGGSSSTVNPSTRDKASVTVWNLLTMPSGNVPDLNTIINGQSCGSATPYQSATINNGLNWDPKTPLLAVRTAVNPGGTRLVSEDKIFGKDSFWTLVQIGLVGSTVPATQPKMVYALKDRAKPAANQLKIRFLHASPGAKNMDLWLGRTGSEVKVLSNFAYSTMSGYLTITLPTVAQGLTLIGTEAGVAPDVKKDIFRSGNLMTIMSGGRIYFAPITPAAGLVTEKPNYLIAAE